MQQTKDRVEEEKCMTSPIRSSVCENLTDHCYAVFITRIHVFFAVAAAVSVRQVGGSTLAGAWL